MGRRAAAHALAVALPWCRTVSVWAPSGVNQDTCALAPTSRCPPLLPKALLSAERPLRAFVGHVEPTYDGSIRQPDTRRALTAGITAALWDRLFLEKSCPIGHAFRAFYEPIGTFNCTVTGASWC